MAVENLATNFTTSLASNGGSITSSATSFNVAASLPSGVKAPFRAVIYASGATTGEIVLVTAVSSLAWTVTRGQETALGAPAASVHNDGDSVAIVLTAQGLLNMSGQPSVNVVTQYGADPTGVAAADTAINNAINSLASTGGVVYFPPGTYLVNTGIVMGNGTGPTPGVPSTKAGVHLAALDVPGAISYGAGNSPPAQIAGAMVTLKAGAAISNLVKVAGPLQGWGLSNIYLHGNSLANVCLQVVAGQLGEVKNLTVGNFLTKGIEELPVDLMSSGTILGNSMRNRWVNTTVDLPDVNGVVGLHLHTQGSVNQNTCFEHFEDTWIGAMAASTGHTLTGIRLGGSDSCWFENTSFNWAGGLAGTCIPVNLDNTENASWPQGHWFVHTGLGGSASTNIVTGAAGTAEPTRFIFFSEGGGFPPNPNIANVIWGAIGVDFGGISVAKKAAGQVITPNTHNALTWDTNTINTLAAHSTTTNPTRFTAPVAGWYEVGCEIGAPSPTASSVSYITSVYVTYDINGSGLGTYMLQSWNVPFSNTTGQGLANACLGTNNCFGGSETRHLNAGDYVVFNVYFATSGTTPASTTLGPADGGNVDVRGFMRQVG
jgi:hypothetical protein